MREEGAGAWRRTVSVSYSRCRLIRLSLTHTQRAGDVIGVAGLADAVVGAQGVDALAVLTQVSHHTAFIDV